MKTSKLVVEHDYEFEVYSIITSIKAHKLAWVLNDALHINLIKELDLMFEFLKEKSKLYFINYKFETDYSYFRLVKNKACEYYNTSKPFLIPELKEYDYLLIFSKQTELNGSVVINKLKNISSVEYINAVEIDNLKSKENLIF